MQERASESLLEAVEVSPPPGTEADAAVIWMHGLGADGHDFEPIVGELGLDPSLRVRFVFPHAPMIPVSLNGGWVMRAWYDLKGPALDRIEHDEPGVRRSARAIEALVAREKTRGIPASRIVLAGFSQGGAMALHVGLRHPEPLAGIVALSSFLVLGEKLPDEASPANLRTPILVCHGTLDPMVPERMGRASYDRLKTLGYDAEYHRWPMQHQVCTEEIQVVGRWLGSRLAPRRAGA